MGQSDLVVHVVSTREEDLKQELVAVFTQKSGEDFFFFGNRLFRDVIDRFTFQSQKISRRVPQIARSWFNVIV